MQTGAIVPLKARFIPFSPKKRQYVFDISEIHYLNVAVSFGWLAYSRSLHSSGVFDRASSATHFYVPV